MSHNMLGQQFELYGVKYQGGEQARSQVPEDLYHGTDESGIDSIGAKGQRAHTVPLQMYGPGFYVTPDEYKASEYARMKSGMTGHQPAVEYGQVHADNPAAMDAEQLSEIGRRFRQTSPRLADHPMTDAALGNIALRQAGHDYLHLNMKQDGDDLNIGVVLRPKRWEGLEIHEPQGSRWAD